jgi:hypothetical protein
MAQGKSGRAESTHLRGRLWRQLQEEVDLKERFLPLTNKRIHMVPHSFHEDRIRSTPKGNVQ